MTNSVRHSGSAVPGGVVTVMVAVVGESVRVEVTDRIGTGSRSWRRQRLPAMRRRGTRGLWLVDALSARWGYQRGGGLATTWFELGHGG